MRLNTDLLEGTLDGGHREVELGVLRRGDERHRLLRGNNGSIERCAHASVEWKEGR